LWSAFAGSQIGGWVLLGFSIVGRSLVKRSFSKILDTLRRRLIDRSIDVEELFEVDGFVPYALTFHAWKNTAFIGSTFCGDLYRESAQ
jgi:hypothetical protein